MSAGKRHHLRLNPESGFTLPMDLFSMNLDSNTYIAAHKLWYAHEYD